MKGADWFLMKTLIYKNTSQIHRFIYRKCSVITKKQLKQLLTVVSRPFYLFGTTFFNTCEASADKSVMVRYHVVLRVFLLFCPPERMKLKVQQQAVASVLLSACVLTSLGS